jgi:hypothetical protein
VAPWEPTHENDLRWSDYAAGLMSMVVWWVVGEALFDLDWISSVAHAAFNGVLAGLGMCAVVWLMGWRRRAAAPRDHP